MSTVVDLGALGSSGFTIVGDTILDQAGYSVSEAGDVNGDGFADIIIGAPHNDRGGISAGAAYVVFGKAGGFGTIDLTSLQPPDGFLIQGDLAFDRAGYSVSGAGDINGDGFDDLIVGAAPSAYGWGPTSLAYVIFGKASPSSIDLSNLAPSAGFKMVGDFTYAYGAVSVSAAGDVNGDGFDDIVVGALYDNYTAGPFYGSSSGAAYVVFGKASGFGTIDLPNLSAGAGFEIIGPVSSFAGRSVSGAGDVNGDGFDDIIVGVPVGSSGGSYSGQAYVVFGKASGFGPIDLSSLSSSAGFVIQGADSGDQAGFSVSAAGDINGDGFDDLVIGAPDGDNGGTNAGEAYVLFGKTTGFGTIDLGSFAPSAGFIIQGYAAYDRAGWSVSNAGDVNGDGFTDIIVGALSNDAGGDGAGQAYLIFGKAGGFGNIDLTNLQPANGFIIRGDVGGDNAGFSVSGTGDVNNDGFDDLIIGAPGGDAGGTDAGEAYVIFGSAKFTQDVRNDFNGDGRSDVLWRNDNGSFTTWLAQANGGFISNDANSFAVVPPAWRVVGTGDFNGDGQDDVVWRRTDGAFTEWLSEGNGTFELNDANAWAFVPTSWKVDGVGDFNGDGKDDLIWRRDDGAFTTWLAQGYGIFASNDTNSWTTLPTSWQVAATGDFNGDGRDDIAWRRDDGAFTTWLAQGNGSFTSNDANSFAVLPTNWQVEGAGDFNGDGRDDLVWRRDDGAFTTWLAQTNGGFVSNDTNSWTTLPTSWQVAEIGDYNGDGRDDILWRNSNGSFTNWLAQGNGSFVSNDANAYAVVPTAWHVQGPDTFWA